MVERSSDQRVAAITVARLKVLLAFIAFRIVLDFGYIAFVHAYYAYAGYDLDVLPAKYLISWLFLLAAGWMVPTRFTQAADLFLMYLGAAMLVPLTAMYGLASAPLIPITTSFVAYAVVHGTALVIPPLAAPHIAKGRTIAVALASFALSVVLARMIVQGGLTNFNLDLRAVYEFREVQAEIIGGSIFNYANVWAGKVMAPFLIAIGLLYRQWVLVAVALLAHVALYGFTAHKAVLFYPLVVVGIWLLFRRRPLLWTLPAALGGAALAALLASAASGDLLYASLFVRRVFFVPARLTLDYFEFFSSNPVVLWSNSILAAFTTYPYEVSVARTIGSWNGSGASANNGFVASGFAHAHFFGVFAYSFTLGAILWGVNSVDRYIQSKWFPASVSIVPLMATVSSDLLTSMLTHGILPMLLVLLLVSFRRHEASQRTASPTAVPARWEHGD